MSLAGGAKEAEAFQDEFAGAVLAGLSGPAKNIPCRFLYDARGSALFEDRTTETGLGAPSLAYTAFGTGWLAKIKVSYPDELGSLLSAAEYEAFLEETGGEAGH